MINLWITATLCSARDWKESTWQPLLLLSTLCIDMHFVTKLSILLRTCQQELLLKLAITSKFTTSIPEQSLPIKEFPKNKHVNTSQKLPSISNSMISSRLMLREFTKLSKLSRSSKNFSKKLTSKLKIWQLEKEIDPDPNLEVVRMFLTLLKTYVSPGLDSTVTPFLSFPLAPMPSWDLLCLKNQSRPKKVQRQIKMIHMMKRTSSITTKIKISR